MNKISKHINLILRNEYILLSIMLLFGLIVRLYKINNPIADWHSWRQADTASVSRTFVDQGIDLLHPRYQDISSIQTGLSNPKGWRMVEVPLYNLIHVEFCQIFGRLSFDAWGRLTSVIFSLMSAVLIFWLGRRFIGKRGGVLASGFFLFLPYNVYFSRVVLPEAMAVTLGLASLVLFVKFVGSDKSGFLYASGLAMALALLVKPFVIFYSVPMVYLAIQKYTLKRILTEFRLLYRFLIFIDLIAIPLLLWRRWISQYPEGIPFTTWMFNGDVIRFRIAFWRWIFGERIGRLILGIWGLIPFAFGLVTLTKKNLFSLFFILGMVLYLVVFATVNVRHDYYQIITIPAISLLLAEGLIYLVGSKSVNPWISRPLAVLSISMMIIIGTYQVKDYYQINHPEIIEAGKAVDQLVPKNALVIAPYNGDTAFLYQTHRWGWPAIDDSIDNIIKKGASYYVSVSIGDADTQMVMKRFITIKRTDTYVIVDLLKPNPSHTK